jgi:alpha-ketoglutaric semialdehyde dehydrogenase
VPDAQVENMKAAVDAAATALPAWRDTAPRVRSELLRATWQLMQDNRENLARLMTLEMGKTLTDSNAEVTYSSEFFRWFAEEAVRVGGELRTAPSGANRILTFRQPVGVALLVTPWNFPAAMATRKIAPALAAGCTVIVKGHPAHPGTDAMVADAIYAAARRTGMPDGVFGHIRGPSNELGAALVCDPRIAAVGFTGSRGGGLALVRLAQQRHVPIPIYAEMSSINPVILMPAALASRGAALGTAFVGSLTMGAGQFCTNPGLVLAIDSDGLEAFTTAAAAALGSHAPQPMLTGGIRTAFAEGTGHLAADPAVEQLACGLEGDGITREMARLFAIDAAAFVANPALAAEVFGVSSLIVRCRDLADLERVVATLEGQLTVTIHLDAEDIPTAQSLIPLLERKAGRVLANGWPTGVEVAHAMVHGGPYPATSDGRSTSVGSLAIDRFLRPVCYQDLPSELLPRELRDGAPGPKLIDGVPA